MACFMVLVKIFKAFNIRACKVDFLESEVDFSTLVNKIINNRCCG